MVENKMCWFYLVLIHPFHLHERQQMSPFILRTKAAFDAKMQKVSKSTDFRVSLTVCTMFNVLMDAKKQCSKLCVLDSGQEVGQSSHPAMMSFSAPVNGAFSLAVLGQRAISHKIILLGKMDGLHIVLLCFF